MKRSSGKPYLRSEGEMKINNRRQYDAIVSKPSKINPIFLRVPDYGIKREDTNG